MKKFFLLIIVVALFGLSTPAKAQNVKDTLTLKSLNTKLTKFQEDLKLISEAVIDANDRSLVAQQKVDALTAKINSNASNASTTSTTDSVATTKPPTKAKAKTKPATATFSYSYPAKGEIIINPAKHTITYRTSDKDKFAAEIAAAKKYGFAEREVPR